jgi:hypothetical protein
MKLDNEVAGDGNSYTTFFRELDTRLGRWWAVDPKVASQPYQSSYCSMDNNPIRYNDVLGDSIKTNEKGWEQIKEGLNATLKEKNPFTFNSNKGAIEFDNNIDISKLDDKQKEIVNNYKSLVEDKQFIVNVQVFNNDEKFIGKKGEETTLREQEAKGVTLLRNEKQADVFLSDSPLIRRNGALSPEYQKEDEQGITSLHEIGGHSYYYSQKVFNKMENNSKTEQFERNARDSYDGKYLKNYIKKQEVKGHFGE